MKINIPFGAKHILNKLHKNGFQAYIIGGCIRDSILQRPIHDWDICTSATTDEIEKILSNNIIYRTSNQHHGTLTVISCDEKPYEITTFRTDNQKPSLFNDVCHRDFTMNALAYNEQEGLIDLIDGIEDIDHKIIRCVGEPISRFMEDGLRIMRALRFASTYCFTIDSLTNEAIHRAKSLLEQVAPERIRYELLALMKGEGLLYVLINYHDVIETIIPELKPCFNFMQFNQWHNYDLYRHIVHAVDNYKGDDDIINMALLLHDIGKPKHFTKDDNGRHYPNHGHISANMAKPILRKLRFPKQDIHDIVTLIEYHDKRIEETTIAIKHLLSELGVKQFYRLMEIREADIMAQSTYKRDIRLEKVNHLRQIADDILKNPHCLSIKEMDITGNDLITQYHLMPGKTIGNTLKHLLTDILDEKIPNQKEKLLEQAKLYIS